jgi:hypothetical protein
MKRFSFLLLLSLVGAHVADRAAASQTEEEPTVLTITPQAEPSPALRYLLLPPLLERRPGNAAILYFKTGLNYQGSGVKELDEKLPDWIYEPLDKLPRQQAREELARWKTILDDLDVATRRADCDWQFPIGERNLITLLLPEVQLCRLYGRLLRLQARLQIVDGNFNEAIHTLQSNFALAQHVSEGPTLINGLVAAAISSEACATVRDLIQQPGAPNLYWALTALPRPLVSMRRAMEMESSFLYASYPRLQNVETDERTPDEWQEALNDLFEVLRMAEQNSNRWESKLARTGLALKAYPRAKARLIEQGRGASEVEAMPVAQVVLIDILRTYNELRDEIFRWMTLPYAEAVPFMDQAVERLAKTGKEREVLPLASLLLPAVNASTAAFVRLDRQVAALRTVEAIRMHAAEHGGLPASLDDIKQVPIPIDPVTGQRFEYSVDGKTARLGVPKRLYAVDYGFPFELRLKPTPERKTQP